MYKYYLSQHTKKWTLWFSDCRSSNLLFGLQTCVFLLFFFCLKLPYGLYYMSANSKGSGETALTGRLTSAFAGCLCDKYSFLMCWLIFCAFCVPSRKHTYNFDPLKPHFYIVKLGFTGVYIIFLISAQNIDCGYSLEPPL